MPICIVVAVVATIMGNLIIIYFTQRGADEQPRRGLLHSLVRRIEDPPNGRICSSAPRSAGESPPNNY
jgi:hypothetical protein